MTLRWDLNDFGDLNLEEGLQILLHMKPRFFSDRISDMNVSPDINFEIEKSFKLIASVSNG